MPRVLHVIGNLGLGGAQSLLYYLHHRTSSGGFDPEYCVLGESGHFGERLKEQGAVVHEIRASSYYSPYVLFRLVRVLQKRRYDVVHAHLFPELAWAALAVTASRSGAVLVYTEHQAWNRRRSLGRMMARLESRLYGVYDCITAVNETTRDQLVRWIPGITAKVIVVPNRIPPSDDGRWCREPRASAGTRLLFAGRLTHQKGVDVLLDAIALLNESDVECVIAGDGPDRVDLEQRARALGISSCVRFLGFHGDVRALMTDCDVFVLPSRWEGLPIVLLEALAAGCPIVATRVDGTAEILVHGVSGALVPPSDPAALAGAIQSLLRSRPLREALAAGARERASQFAAWTTADSWVRVYAELMKRDAPAA